MLCTHLDVAQQPFLQQALQLVTCIPCLSLMLPPKPASCAHAALPTCCEQQPTRPKAN